MADEPVERSAWKCQDLEPSSLDISALRRRAGVFRHSVRRRNLREYAASALVVGCFGWLALREPSLLARIGAVALAAGSLYTAWQLHRRAAAPAWQPNDAAVPCVDFHRRELERQRAALASVWKWYLAPMAPGLTLFVLGVTAGKPGGHYAAAITLALCGAVFCGVGILNRRAAARLAKEIAALDEQARAEA